MSALVQHVIVAMGILNGLLRKSDTGLSPYVHPPSGGTSTYYFLGF